jgi:Flp pilus assembly protein CpaB
VGAAALALLAVVAMWTALRPAEAQTVPVTVAARPIAAGARITDADLKTVRWPADARLPGVLRPGSAAGRTAVTSISVGEPVTATRAARSTWTTLRRDEQAFTVPLADPSVIALLSPGDLLDLYDPTDRHLVAAGVRVVMSTTPKVEPSGAGSAPSATLVVAVDRRHSAEFAGSLAGAATVGTGLIAAARPGA